MDEGRIDRRRAGFGRYLFRSQSIGLTPCLLRASLTLENGRLPKKPLAADSGDGWDDWMMV